MNTYKLIFTAIAVSIFNLGCYAQNDMDRARITYWKSKGTVEERAKLLEEYAQISEKKGYHLSLLVEALQKNDKELFEYLLAKGADLNDIDHFGFGPINIAVENNDIDFVKRLISLGAKPSKPEINPLNKAVQLGEFYQGNAEMVKLLLKNKARLTPSKQEDTTPLFFVKNIKIAKTLIDNGVPINAKRKNGATALMNTLGLCDSSKMEALQMLKLFIDNGADVNAIQNIEDETILDMAIGYGYPKEIVTFLRKHGAKRAQELKTENKD